MESLGIGGGVNMNTFKKYCHNVYVMRTDDSFKKSDTATVVTKHGKEVEVEVYKFLGNRNGNNFYSIIRVEDMNYAERKAERYAKSVELHNEKSDAHYEASKEGKEFLALGEPIKIGHHSEHRHRALIERNHDRMGKSIKENEIAQDMENKAKFWEEKAKEITLAMPESLAYFEAELENALAHHKGLKDGTIPREHGYALQYAKKLVKELSKKVEIAKTLWGE